MSENNTLSLDISIDDINAMEPTALKSYAEKQSALILERIQDAVAEIEEYQSSPDEKTDLKGFKSRFKNVMSNGDYKRDQDIDALYRSVTKIKTDSGSAMLKIVTLVQDSLKFTCATTKLSGQMTSAISVMMANGFKDSNGNLRQLDDNTREFAEFILGQADMFVKKPAGI